MVGELYKSDIEAFGYDFEKTNRFYNLKQDALIGVRHSIAFVLNKRLKSMFKVIFLKLYKKLRFLGKFVIL